MADEYRYIRVETYRAQGEASGSTIRVRPLPGQGYPAGMHVECSKSMRHNHPVGTRFLIQAKEKTKEGGPPFLYSSYKWKYTVI